MNDKKTPQTDVSQTAPQPPRKEVVIVDNAVAEAERAEEELRKAKDKFRRDFAAAREGRVI
jgi:hypothetical protein